MYHKQKNCLNSCFLQLIYLLSGLFLRGFFSQFFFLRGFSWRFLVSQGLLRGLFLKGPPQGLKSSLEYAQWLIPLLFEKKRKFVEITTRHSLSLVVPVVVVCCHSLSLVVPLIVTRCHSMYHLSVFLSTILGQLVRL